MAVAAAKLVLNSRLDMASASAVDAASQLGLLPPIHASRLPYMQPPAERREMIFNVRL
jgi:hypothetical protein